MSRLKFFLPGIILLTGLVVPSTISFGKVEYMKKEKKGCITCHASAGSKALNKVGECYKQKKSLEGCVAN